VGKGPKPEGSPFPLFPDPFPLLFPDLITGEVDFSPLVGDRTFEAGTFKAVRKKNSASLPNFQARSTSAEACATFNFNATLRRTD
jgi:hypothetical protein